MATNPREQDPGVPETRLWHDPREEVLRLTEQLRKTNMELDNFIYSVSHNLKAPLASILGLINIARQEDKQMGCLTNPIFGMIENSVLRLEETLKEILDYSRNARLTPLVEPIDVIGVFNACCEKLRYVPHFQRIKKKLVADCGTLLQSDLYRITIIIQNLLSNAIKYQDTRKRKRYVHVEVSTGPDGFSIVFRDNGIGIEKSQVPFVFNMFHRASGKSDGAGLGLYIVKEAVEMLRGRITLDSKLNRGTTVTVHIPRPPAPPAE